MKITPQSFLLLRWGAFVWERFPPFSHGVMVVAFALSHAALVDRISSPFVYRQETPVAWVALLLLSFFFRMRLFDELKDYQGDLQLHPERPLPRGLLAPRHLQIAIAICLLLEIVLVLALGNKQALWFLLGAQAYSLLMFKEFFIGSWLRPRLTTYAVTHTAVVVWLSLLSSVLVSGRQTFEVSNANYAFALGCWGVFNLFEFGRKTFASTEEHPNADSYSKVWGHAGAVMLNLSQLVLGLVAIGLAVSFHALTWACGGAMFVALAAAGLLYVQKNSVASAKIYRSISSLGILIVLLWFLVEPQKEWWHVFN